MIAESKARLGQIVLWLQKPDAEPCPAIVAAVRGETISCTVFHENGATSAREDVRHINDARRHLSFTDGAGCWQEAPSE